MVGQTSNPGEPGGESRTSCDRHGTGEELQYTLYWLSDMAAGRVSAMEDSRPAWFGKGDDPDPKPPAGSAN